MRELWRDFGYALRQLRRSPGFALTSALTLSLTVGLAAAVFSVFDALLVRPLPYGEPERIVSNHSFSDGLSNQPASLPELKFWREHNSTYAAMAGSTVDDLNLLGPQGPSVVHAVNASEDFFAVLGVAPMLGRGFGPQDLTRANVAVLSYGLWRNRFGAKPGVLGSKIDLDARPMTVIGVMPPGFRYPLTQTETVYTPLTPEQLKLTGSGSHWLPTFGRLKPGVSLDQAEADLNRVLAAYARIEPNGKGRRMRIETMAESLVGQTGGLLRVLVLAVVAVLALGCVNIAGLMLARGLRRGGLEQALERKNAGKAECEQCRRQRSQQHRYVENRF